MKIQKFTAVLLSLITAASMVSVPAYAAVDNDVQQGAVDEAVDAVSSMYLGDTDEISSDIDSDSISVDADTEISTDDIDEQLSSDLEESIIPDNATGKSLMPSGAALEEPSLAANTDTAASSASNSKSAADYTYTVTPLLEPFNEFFFVKTDNPDPKSFRFADKSSVYVEESDKYAVINIISEDEPALFADVKYEDDETGLVNGGYIFKSYYTDGGEIALQSKVTDSSNQWEDTNIKLKLPVLKDDIDYLVDTYATKSSFFDNMDAVQKGLSSISFYSGISIRGELYKRCEYWFAFNARYVDQVFYINSPYSRKDNKAMLASYIYPYQLDSILFPSLMASVAYKLDSNCTCKWSSNSHAYIDVTYNGKTKQYGGQGSIEGQEISEDKIKHYFTLDSNDKISLNSSYQLLKEYCEIEMDDDIPRDDELTWKQIYDNAGKKPWAHLTDDTYVYLYQSGDGTYFDANNFGNGNSLYWWGDLKYLKDTWVEGRYIGTDRAFVKGEKFEDHQTSNIVVMQATVPQITYTKSNGKYTVTNIKETKQKVLFNYNDGVWKASSSAFDSQCTPYYIISEMVEQGALDKKYLDMVTLTLDEVKALNVDKNTNLLPESGYNYDGTTEPGTPFVNYTPDKEELKNTSDLSTYDINVGDTVDINCSAEGGSGDYSYAIYYKRENQNSWTTKSEMSKKSSVKFTPMHLGYYSFKIVVKDSSGTTKSKILKCRIIKDFENVSTVSATSVNVGETIKINCKADGVGDVYKYAVYYKRSDSDSWITKSDYSKKNSFTLTPAYEGTYTIKVDIKQETPVSKI